MKRSWRRTLRAMVVPLALAPVVAVSASGASAAPTGLNVNVGGVVPSNPTIDLQHMYPYVGVVHVGDKVTFNFMGFHNVAFRASGERAPLILPTGGTYAPQDDAAGNPYWWGGIVPMLGFNLAVAVPTANTTVDGSSDVNSGLPSGAPFVAKFAKTGTYEYFCEIHPAMRGFIRVAPKGAGIPSVAQQQATAAAQLKSDAAAATKLADQLGSIGSKNPSYVTVGDGTPGFSVNGMFPAVSKVKVGTTLDFRLKGTNEVHTISFGDHMFLDDLAAKLFAGPALDPEGGLPSDPAPPGTTLTVSLSPKTHGNGFVNSGIIQDRLGPAPHDFKVTFTKPGEYHYMCLIHAGMEGMVEVSA